MKKIRILAVLLSVALIVSSTACTSKRQNAVSSTASIESSAVSTASEEVSSAMASSTAASSVSKSIISRSSVTSSNLIKVRPDISKPSNANSYKPKQPAGAILPTIKLTNKNIKVCIAWSPKSTWVESWQAAMDMCYPGCTVTYSVVTNPSLLASRLAVWKQSGTSPDLVYARPESVWPTIVNQNLVQPIDNMIELKSAFWKTADALTDSTRINGKAYSLIAGIYPRGYVIYAKNTLKNAGLTDPRTLYYQNKWTWDTFLTYAKKLTKIDSSDNSKSRFGVVLAYPQCIIASAGKDLIGYDTSKSAWVSNLKDPAITRAMNLIKQLGPTGDNYTLTGETDDAVIKNGVVSGQYGMYVTVEAPGQPFPDAVKKGLMSWAPFPRETSSSPNYECVITDAFCIPQGAANPMGGVAYATAVRAMNVLNLDVSGMSAATKSDPGYSSDDLYLDNYLVNTFVPVPEYFLRLSGTFEYYNIWSPVLFGSQSYSAVVAENEPKILEALNNGNG